MPHRPRNPMRCCARGHSPKKNAGASSARRFFWRQCGISHRVYGSEGGNSLPQAPARSRHPHQYSVYYVPAFNLFSSNGVRRSISSRHGFKLRYRLQYFPTSSATPNSKPRLFDIRSHGSRKNCALSSSRSFHSSTEMDSPRLRTAGQYLFADTGDWRCNASSL